MSLDIFISADFWSAMVRVSAPIALAALACTLASRAGVLFISIEGTMLLTAFFAIAGTAWTGSVVMGVVIAAAVGVLAALVFGVLSMTLRMGDVVAGLTVHVFALGLAPFLAAQLFPQGATIGSRSLRPIWPSFGGSVGDVLFHQQPLVYVAILVAVLMALFLRTRTGLRVRSSGESIRVAQTLGVDLVRLRFAVLAVSGALAGLAGATLGLAAGTFDVNVVTGQGFIGLACVMLGAWQPLAVLLAAAVFATAYAVQFRVDALGGWIQLFPYVLTLVAMSVAWGRVQGPPEEGRGLPEGAGR